MKQKKHTSTGNSIARLVLVGITLLLQVVWIIFLAIRLNESSIYVSLCTSVLALLVVLKLYGKHTNSAIKMPWIMLILVFPVMGLSLYLLVELLGNRRLIRKRLQAVREKLDAQPPQSPETQRHLENLDPGIANQFRYLTDRVGAQVYEDTDVVYYADAADAFAALKAAVSQAESFIFLEYFIIEDAESFQELRQLLLEKVRQGVEVRIMYDDVGCIGYLNLQFARQLQRDGIACRIFNPVIPILNLFLNNRDHRKITVVDGKVGFTGGFNLANEYFGLAHPYGAWKDTGIRLEGPAVCGLTRLFLELWNVQNFTDSDCSRYLQPAPAQFATGFVAPFGDNPMDSERVAENVYLNLISQAKKSLYLITPYLIITDEMRSALGLAAKRGVDVRIITPGIPDKKVIYSVTRSYYNALVIQGVRIFEYTPGFCHAKQCICDGEIASIGTSNLDYRSLYLHFENDVLLYGCDAVAQMAADFEALFPQCREVTEKYRSGRSAMLRIGQCILRLFAPLM